MTEQQQESTVLGELTQLVMTKETNRKLFADHEQREFTPEEATEGAMQVFTSHLHDPLTIERACIAYFKQTGTNWGDLNELTKEMWRKNVQAMMKAVLE